MLHDTFALLFRNLTSLIPTLLKWVGKRMAPQFSAIWGRLFPLEIGDTALWQGNDVSVLVLERRRSGLAYEYKVVSLKGMNPLVIPLLAANPHPAKDAPVFWYKGPNLKKTGHPQLKIKLALRSSCVSNSA